MYRPIRNNINLIYINFAVMSKKAPKFHETLESRGRKKKTKSAEYFKQR